MKGLFDDLLATHALRRRRAREGPHRLRDLEEVFLKREWPEWKAIFEKSGVTFGQIARPSDHLDCAQIAANGLLPEIEGTSGLRTVDSPIVVEGEPKRPPRMAPTIGEHTKPVLRSFGYDDAAIARLVESGAAA